MFDFQGAANFRFLFYYRCSDIGIPFIRSEIIIQRLKPLLACFSSHTELEITDVGLQTEEC